MAVHDWARIVTRIADSGFAAPEVLFFALAARDITLKTGERSMDDGYPTAISAVADALGRERGDVEREVMARLVRRAHVAHAVIMVRHLRHVIESCSEVGRVGGFEPRNPMDHVILARRYMARHGLSVPQGEVSLPWRRLLVGLSGLGVADPGTLALLVRSRNVGLRGQQEVWALDDDDADVTVASALQLGAGSHDVPSVQDFLDGSSKVARHSWRQVQDAENLLYSLAEVLSVWSLDRSDLPTWLARLALENSAVMAPWKVSDEGPRSMGWRMGPGEDHMDAWLAFWRTLSDEERGAYLADGDVPDEWLKWIESRS